MLNLPLKISKVFRFYDKYNSFISCGLETIKNFYDEGFKTFKPYY